MTFFSQTEAENPEKINVLRNVNEKSSGENTAIKETSLKVSLVTDVTVKDCSKESGSEGNCSKINGTKRHSLEKTHYGIKHKIYKFLHFFGGIFYYFGRFLIHMIFNFKSFFYGCYHFIVYKKCLCW